MSKTSRFIVLVTALMLVATPAFAAPGGLDTAFDGNGYTVLAGNGAAQGIQVLSDGKMLIGGEMNNDLAAVRLKGGGGLDDTYGGGDGIATLNLGGADRGLAFDATSTGATVVAGYSPNGGDFDTAVARFGPEGGPVNAFGGDGGKEIDFKAGVTDRAQAVAFSGNKIVLGGTAIIDGKPRFMVARLLSDGRRDPNFGGGDGVTITKIGNVSEVNDIEVLPDGSIVAVGYTRRAGSGLDFALARYKPNGLLDGAFGGDGIVYTDTGDEEEAEGVGLLANGRLLVVGHRGRDMYVRWYFQNGVADGSMGVNGYLRIAYGVENAVAYDAVALSNGKAIVVGFVTDSDQELAVVRLTLDGYMDDSFGGGDGLAVHELGGGVDAGYGGAVTPGGRLVVTGITDGFDPMSPTRSVIGSMFVARLQL